MTAAGSSYRHGRGAPWWAPGWGSAAGILVFLGAAWTAVYLAGGTHSALPHVFYVPIVLAAVPFGIWGGLATAIVATLLCGPLMPLDVASGADQPLANWLARGVFFVGIGTLVGLATGTLRNTYSVGLTARLHDDVADLVDGQQSPDPAVRDQIEQVLAQRRFHPVFQPIYALDDGRLVAVEALTRFEAEPSQPPNVWFEQGAQLGLGPELELAAIEEALAECADLPDEVAVSVNSSPKTLIDPRLIDLFDRYPGRTIIVEVTEHAVIDDYDVLDHARVGLRARGVKLAVDDAGAGFASLRHIVRLGPEYIKLDPSLTRDIRYDPVRQALADSLIQFARKTRSHIVVEGIEQSTDLITWRDLGAHAAQGYLLARPGPLPAAETYEMPGTRPARRLAIPRA